MNLGICCKIKICPGSFCLIYIFWHYCTNNFEFKMFLLILGYIEILLMKSLHLNGYKWLLSQKQRITIDFLRYRRDKTLTQHIKHFLKKWKDDSNRPIKRKMEEAHLTHFTSIFLFYTPWKCHKTFGFLTFSRGIEMKHWRKMG